jgi:magnesium-transporting ATPase (P-type)
MLVTAVGDNSEWGKTISLVTSSGDEQTPLQEKLGHVAATVGKIGATVAATCFFALLVRFGCLLLCWVLASGGLTPARPAQPPLNAHCCCPLAPTQHPS